MRRKELTLVIGIAMVLSSITGLAVSGIVPGDGASPLYITHAPFRINSNAEFASMALAEGWNGSGIEADPWIIEGYDFNGTGYGYCIFIGNTTDYFVVRNCYMHEAIGINAQPININTGLTLYNLENGIVANCTASNNTYGIYLWNSNGVTITNNTASMNTDAGINLDKYNHDIIISGNTASGNSFGLIQWDNDYNNIVHNIFLENIYYGIYLRDSDFNIIANNMISGSNETWEGILLDNSNNNNITENHASNNGAGIDIWWNSNNNTITYNTVTENYYGIFFNSSNGNIIYHNNIINNTNQAYDDGANSWDDGYPSGGNYWSDYAYVDLFSGLGQNETGSDGIGDWPYDTTTGQGIEGGAGNQDNYPLMEPWTFSNDTLTFDIPIFPGWNFISTPLIQENTNVLAVLDDNGGDTIFNISKWYDPTDPADPWKTYRVGTSFNDLTDIDHRMGLYIYIEDVGSDSNLTVKGSLPRVRSRYLFTLVGTWLDILRLIIQLILLLTFWHRHLRLLRSEG